ncbi:ABC transporter ATP-binding protein [Tolumonas auensis]|uniref:ABC transporter ATP-binding protein n=1 Tax=Tolumonas auensis TaxID=43948 RepID=UPI002AA6DB54|nr:ABC transporter ATP-binding protein [Tolumonas auensis]
MNSILRAEKLTRILPGEVPVTLVQDIDLEIGQSEFVAIMGPSGSGKSSLLYLLGLLDSPTSGKLWLEDEETSRFSDSQLARIRLQRIGFVFQFHFLLAEFSSLENVMLPMRKLGLLSESQAREKAGMLLDSLDMREHKHKLPSQLSGGQRQRVAVARALANDPVLILADEPTGALDTKSSANVRDILHDLSHNQQCAIVAVTHDPEFALAADRQIHLIDGHLVP